LNLKETSSTSQAARWCKRKQVVLNVSWAPLHSPPAGFVCHLWLPTLSMNGLRLFIWLLVLLWNSCNDKY
jgi:hypothetical protein